ncbi:MAG: DUF1189 family protein [Legionella sp.]|nr:DUF1189 family protein [Legionella sp.]
MKKQQSTALRDIDAPHYNYWQALYHSFFNAKLYVDVGKRWKGFPVGYLLLLIFIMSIPVSLRVVEQFHHFFEQQIIMPLKKLPPFYVQNGEVSLDKPMPYMVKNDAGQVIAIVDTSGSISTIDNQYPQLAILITKNKLIYRAPTPPKLFEGSAPTPVSINERPFDKGMNQVFDGSQWIKSSGINAIELLVEIIIYPTIALLFFVVYLVLLFVFSLMAQLVAKVLLKFELTYGQAVRLLTVSATPQIVVLMIIVAFNLFFAGISFLMIVLLATYFSFAVLSLKRESNKLVLR